jgi:hypothetical protein
MKVSLAALLLGTGLVISCKQNAPAPPPPSEAEQTEVRQAGHAVADKLVQTLGGQLKAALESGGPVAAVTVCQSAAQPLTSSVTAGTPGTTVRRTALKVRNPANAADATDLEVLMEFAKLPPDQGPAEIIRWTENTARFYKPLVTQEVCTKCHGDPAGFSPELRQLLDTAYPDDQATGYQVGDLRGVIRVDVQRR